MQGLVTAVAHGVSVADHLRAAKRPTCHSSIEEFHMIAGRAKKALTSLLSASLAISLLSACGLSSKAPTTPTTPGAQTTPVGPTPTIISVTPANSVVNSADQVLTVIGTNVQPGLTASVTSPGGTSTFSGAQMANVTSTSFQISIRFSIAGAWTIRVENPGGQQSNTFAFAVQGNVTTVPTVGTGTTDQTGSTTVDVPGAGPVSVKVVDEAGAPVANATVLVNPSVVAVTAGGYLPTIAFTPAASSSRSRVLVPRSISAASLAVAIKKAGCALGNTNLGKDYVPFLSPVCDANEIIERGLFGCTGGPNLEGRGGVVARWLLLNATSGNILAIADLLPFGVASVVVEQGAALGIPWLSDAYNHMNEVWYSGKPVDYLTVSIPGGPTLYSTWRCPAPSDLAASGSVSGDNWTGSLSWAVDDLLYSSSQVSVWSGSGCDDGTRRDFNEADKPAANIFLTMPFSDPIAASRRSVQVSLPVGNYHWRVVITRLDGKIKQSDCGALKAGVVGGAPLIASISPSAAVGSTFTLTVKGTGFDASGAVVEIYQPNGTFMGNGTVSSRTATQLVTTQSMAGAAPGSYVVKLKNPDGQRSNGVSLSLYDQVSVSPSSGNAGTVFSYTGQGFTGSYGVTSHLKRPDGSEFSTKQIATDATGHFSDVINSTGFAAGTYEVWAIDNNTGIASAHVTFVVIGASVPPPTLSSVSPPNVVGSTFTLIATGTGFDTSGAVVEVYQPNGSFMGNGTVTNRSTTQLITTQSMAGAAPGTYTVRVKNPDGQRSSGVPLTLYDQVSVSPGSGNAGTVFSYAGQGFTGSYGVTSHLKRPDGSEFPTKQIATDAAGHFSDVINSTGFAAGTYEVWAVDNNTGIATAHVTFVVTGGSAPPPPLSSISPSSVVGSTFTLTATVTGFDAGGAVVEIYQPNGSFMGNGTVTSRSTTQLVTIQSMAGAAPGAYTVKVKNPDGQRSNGVTLTLYDQVSVSPSSGNAGTVFTYTGQGFTGSYGVTSHLKRPDGSEFPTKQIATDAAGHFSDVINPGLGQGPTRSGQSTTTLASSAHTLRSPCARASSRRAFTGGWKDETSDAVGSFRDASLLFNRRATGDDGKCDCGQDGGRGARP